MPLPRKMSRVRASSPAPFRRRPKGLFFIQGDGLQERAFSRVADFLQSSKACTFFHDIWAKVFMSLRRQKPDAIQLLSNRFGRKWFCSTLETKMSAHLHCLSQFLHTKAGFNQFKIFGRLKSTRLAQTDCYFASIFYDICSR